MSVASLYTSCFVMFCVFLYGLFCHGAHELVRIVYNIFFFEHLFHLYYVGTNEHSICMMHAALGPPRGVLLLSNHFYWQLLSVEQYIQ